MDSDSGWGGGERGTSIFQFMDTITKNQMSKCVLRVLGSWTRTLSINSALGHMVLHYLCCRDSSISRGKQSSLSATFTGLCPHTKFKHLATFPALIQPLLGNVTA